MKGQNFIFWVVLLFVSVIFITACQGDSDSQKKKDAAITKQQEESKSVEEHQNNQVQSASVADEASLSGKVVETMNSGGYTYILLEKDGQKTWVAIPETEIKVGEEVTLKPGAEMLNFHSNTLNRTFERILFSGGLISSEGSGTASMGPHPSPHGKTPQAVKGDVHVEKATGPNAYTVAELYEKAAQLDKKKVVVRGKVVKVLPNIMGKVWVHIQDGTGDPMKKTNDMVVTTQDLPSVGDVITVEGTLYKDKDFGAGYRYDAIIEEATIQQK